MDKLPFLVSIPHGGTSIPEELVARIRLSSSELLADGDPFTGDIYDMNDAVKSQLVFDVARALIDVNRAPDDLPPDNPDGVIKTVSIFNNPVYHPGQEPKGKEITELLEKYYEPYHRGILERLNGSGIVFVFDCHSMENTGPPIASDAGKKRPLFCLGNYGGKACPEKVTLQFSSCLAKAFSVSDESITINQPFSGGYITQRYGGNPIPLIQIEMSRELYMVDPWYDADLQVIVPERLRELNSCFRKALLMFAGVLSGPL